MSVENILQIITLKAVTLLFIFFLAEFTVIFKCKIVGHERSCASLHPSMLEENGRP